MGSKQNQIQQPPKAVVDVKQQSKQQAPQPRPMQVRLIFYGEARVGKTSIKSRYHHGVLNLANQAVVGGAYITKTIRSKNQKVKVIIDDTCGSERYGFTPPAYFKYAQIILFVFDLINHLSFIRIDYYLQELKRYLSLQNCIVCLVGSRKDLTEQRSTFKEQGLRKAQEIPNCQYYQTSAYTGQGIDQLFQNAVNRWRILAQKSL